MHSEENILTSRNRVESTKRVREVKVQGTLGYFVNATKSGAWRGVKHTFLSTGYTDNSEPCVLTNPGLAGSRKGRNTFERARTNVPAQCFARMRRSLQSALPVWCRSRVTENFVQITLPRVATSFGSPNEGRNLHEE